jgi:hypothetical protein
MKYSKFVEKCKYYLYKKDENIENEFRIFK